MNTIKTGFVNSAEIAIYCKCHIRTAQRKLAIAKKKIGKDKFTFSDLANVFNWSTT